MQILLQLFFFSLTFQLAYHFWIPESIVLGRRIDYLSPTLNVSDILLFILFIFYLYSQKKKRAAKKKIILKFILFLVLIITLISTSSGKTITFFALLKLIEFACLSILIVKLKPKLSDFLLPVGFSSILVCILAIGQFAVQHTLGGFFYLFGERTFGISTPGIAQVVIGGKLFLRPYSTFPHPNALAGFLSTLLPFWLFYNPKRQTRIEYIVRNTVIILSLVTIFLTFSRTAWIVTLIFLGIWLAVKTKNLKKISLIVVGSVGIVLIEELFISRFASIATIDSQSLFERQKQLTAAWKMFQTFPVFGVGLGNFIPSLPNFSTPAFILQPAHSIYVLTLAETGIFGFTLFSILNGLVFFKCFTKKRLVLISSLIAILFLGLFDHYFVTLAQTQFLLVVLSAFVFI